MTTPTRRSTAPASEPLAPADPRLAALWASLTYAVCTLLLAWPALGGGFLVNPHSDQYIGGWPVRDFAGQALKAGQGVPPWDTYLFRGLPDGRAMPRGNFYSTPLPPRGVPTRRRVTRG